MWYVRDVLYAVLNVRVSCFVVRGCGVSRRYIDVCYCDMFSAMSVSFCLSHPVAVSALIFVEACVRVLRCCECVSCM